MTTPVRHTDDAQHTEAPIGRAPVAAPLGWCIALTGAVILLLGSWWAYPLDAPGMWATYRATMFGTVAIMALLALRVDLPKLPFVVLTGLAGVATLLWGLLGEDPTAVELIEIISGAVILVGVALQASSVKDLERR